jgi:prepilin-type N-terminal cleavage/methylation domain-containing protein
MDLFKYRKSSKGFTLIELLIVIAIIGILAAALLVALNPAQKIAAANNARVKADVANMGNSANLFATDSGIRGCVGTYPNSFGFQNPACPAGAVGPIFMGTTTPKDPSNIDYVIVKSNSTVGVGACAGTAASPCLAWAVYGTAYPDTSANPAVVAGFWCWKSWTGQVKNVATASLGTAGDAGCTVP